MFLPSGMTSPEFATTHPKTRKAWRKWLEKNHASCPGVWLIFYKKSTGKSKLSYDEAVEEALCFGWIDSTRRPMDEERFMQRFTPRKSKSGWSGPNKLRIEKMLKLGLMAPTGLAKIEEAKKDGTWESLDKIYAPEHQLSFPEDLLEEFKKNKKAKLNFEKFPLFARRQYLNWIRSAKKAETRKARISQTVLKAAAGKKPRL